MPASRIELFNGKYIDDQMGNGVPEGGTTGQVLAKASNDDYDTHWVTGGGGGTQDLQSVLGYGRTELNLTSNFKITLNEPIATDETKVFHAEYDGKPYIKSEIYLNNYGSEPYFNFGIQEKIGGSNDDYVELRPSGAEFYRSGSTYNSKIAIPINNTTNYTNTLPKGNGVLALSVNGQIADDAGAITISGLPPSGTAGGDLSGTYPNPTVDRIHGVDFQSGTPSTNDVWIYGGSPAKWQHQGLNASQVSNDSAVTGTTVKDALNHLNTTKVETSRTITTTSPLSGGGDLSANRTLSISQANTSTNGYLSSADWNTFNNKQNALTNPVTGTGTNNEIAYFNATGSTIGSLTTATYPSLTELSYVKGVTSGIQTQLGTKVDKSQSAYTMLANNTNASANMTSQTFKDFTSQTYTGTITWTAGTQPSGTNDLNYRWNQIGKLVTLNINLYYLVAGVACTQVAMTLPSDCPIPLIPGSMGSALRILYYGTGNLTSNYQIGGGASRVGLRVNATNNGYELIIITASLAAVSASITVQYYTS